jgi:ATP-dependent DNA helicase RecQ
METQMAQLPDPLSNAVSRLFGLSYLFPYQRLVVANILEAAEAAGLTLHWPDDEQTSQTSLLDQADERTTDLQDEPYTVPVEDNDRGCLGRQIVILPTGAGKSLCFQLPAMLIDGPTLVIYPILSLMADQQRRLHERGFAPVTLRGGQTKEERDEIWKKLETGESKFIIANPEVLLTPQVINKLESIKIVHIVIDEAHCVSEWGESFRPSYLEINTIIKNVNAPLITAFTATASAPVLEKIRRYVFGDLEAHQIVGNPDRPNISYTAKGCIVRDLAVRDLLVQNSRPAIVFCSSRPGTENLARYLRISLGEMGMDWHNDIRFYHAGLSREEKADVEKWFMGNNRAVLCTTCAYGMGVDKADVRTVIHRDCAPSVEAYLQESGRAGRDGAQSKAILLWGPDDDLSIRRAKTEADRSRLSALLDYARNVTDCRRHALLKMLNFDGNGESPETPCCDVCENNANTALREEFTVQDFIRRNKRRYAIYEVAAILAKSKSHHWSEGEVKQVINDLIKAGRIGKTGKIFWEGALTAGKGG